MLLPMVRLINYNQNLHKSVISCKATGHSLDQGKAGKIVQTYLKHVKRKKQPSNSEMQALLWFEDETHIIQKVYSLYSILWKDFSQKPPGF